MSLAQLLSDLKEVSSADKAKFLQKYFRTGKGEYGEGDIFIGLTVPQSHQLARKYRDLSFPGIKKLLYSPIHEHRQIALMILTLQFTKADEKNRVKIYKFYLASTKYINNWDLIDGSAPTIVGGYLQDKPKNVLYQLAKSEIVWERRIAIIATFQFIKSGQFGNSMKIAKLLLSDEHDLIHKAVGWILREVGKRDREILIKFLDQNGSQMPRTTLRYAIEHSPESERRHYLESTRKT